MGSKTGIEWTGSTWTPIRARNTKTGKVGWHCVHKSEACRNCYAESLNIVYGTGLPYKPGHLSSGDVEVFLDEKMLIEPFKWREARPVFPCSTTDLFADFVRYEWIVEMFGVMAVCASKFHGPGDGARVDGHWTTSDGRKVPVRWPNMKRGPHTFQILTKRPDRMAEVVGSDRFRRDVAGAGYRHAHNRVTAGQLADSIEGDFWPLPNVWLGTSAGDQPEADENIKHLLATPAAKRFVSLEPLLGPIDLYNGDPDPRLGGHKATHTFIGEWWERGDDPKGPPRRGVDWVIAGGESGRHARPVHPDWIRSLRDQCAVAEVPFFFKQWGEWLPWSQFTGAGIDDDAEQTRFSTREWGDGKWSDVGHPMWCDTTDGNIDDEQCVGRVGKARAGAMLDGREHREFPT